jgi:UTP--glucose-1-phosphate uridylyltransferase
MAQQVRKAVIAAAGMGTRFLPQTKAMPKEMLPIIDKPVIQLVVEGLVAAGVEDIIIVTGPTKRAIEDHFDRSLELEESLELKGKGEFAKQLKSIAEMANFIYVRQKGQPSGNARPIINASHIVGDEPFFFFFADDFFSGETSTAQQLLEVYNETGSSVVALREVPENEVSSYGIADVKKTLKPGVVSIRGIKEKPDVTNAPSNLAVGSGYLLTPAVIKIVEREEVGTGGEIGIADFIEELAQLENVTGLQIKGTYHDTGNPEAYLHTLIDFALNDIRYSDKMRDFLQKRLTS